jgi:hypothetical protein
MIMNAFIIGKAAMQTTLAALLKPLLDSSIQLVWLSML